MAKDRNRVVRLTSSAGTGYEKTVRISKKVRATLQTIKDLVLKKYDPVVRKVVEFHAKKIK